MTNLDPDEMLTLTDAAEEMRSSRQAVYIAIRKGRLKAAQIHRHWWVRRGDLTEYRSMRYCRLYSTYQGEPLYDLEKGEFGPEHAAKYLGVPKNKIYYLITKGELRVSRRGHHYILLKDMLDEYAKGKVGKNDPQIKFA